MKLLSLYLVIILLFSCKTDYNKMIGAESNGGIIVGVIRDSLIIMSKSDAKEKMNWDNANEYCLQYEDGGYDDWELPTSDELNLIYYNIYKMKNIGDFKNQIHWPYTVWWSSTSDGNAHLSLDFDRGILTERLLDYWSGSVRPVRRIKID